MGSVTSLRSVAQERVFRNLAKQLQGNLELSIRGYILPLGIIRPSESSPSISCT